MADKSERMVRELSQQVDALKDLINHVDPQLKYLIGRIETMASAIDDLKAAVEAEKSVSAGIIALCDDISQKLKDAIAGGDLSAVKQLADDLSGNTRAVQEAILRNTPAAAVEPAPVDSGPPPVDNPPLEPAVPAEPPTQPTE